MPAAPAETVVEALARAAAVAAPRDGLTFVDRDERETRLAFSEVHARALRVAGALAAAGVAPGDRVAIVLPTGPEFMDAFFGTLAAAAVPVPLYPPVRLGRLDEYHRLTAALLSAVGAVAVVTDRRVGMLLGKTVAAARPRLGVLLAGSLLERGGPPPGRAPGPDDLGLIQFSSGTTVDPKPVALTHRALLAQTAALLRFLPLDEPHAGVSWLPLYHDMGLIGCVFPAVCRPGPLTLIPPEVFLARPALWLRAVSRAKATISPAPDFAYALAAARIEDADLEGCELSSWRMALDGAEPISAGTLRAFAARFAKFGLRPEALTPVYGMSETALAVTFSAPERVFRAERFERMALAEGRAIRIEIATSTSTSTKDDATELVSVGTALPGFAVEIRDPAGAPLAERLVGRIWVRGPSLLKEYFGRAETPLKDGWLDTGDLGFLAEGELFIAGRAKDILILRGRNHAPQDVERAVDAVEGVRAGCAAAVAELGDAGERLLVFVEAKAPRPGLPEDCRAAVLAATGLEAADVIALEPGTLPRTSSGKMRRGETLRRWQAGTLAPPDKVTRLGIAAAIARSAIAYLTGR